jgi:Putative zinc-finger
MEHAPLRPVPARPTGPVDPAAITAALPGTSEASVRALAGAMAGRPRSELAAENAVDADELGRMLAAARKALRRTVVALPGSGWCERAERLVSDRLDGELGDRGAALLDVHLRNCSRCVEHERRLVQAGDALLSTTAPPGPGPAERPLRAATTLAVVTEPAPTEILPPLPRHVAMVAAFIVAVAVLAPIATALGAVD